MEAARLGASHAEAETTSVARGLGATSETAVYQAANGVWLTDHVPPGYLPGWSG